MVTLATVREHCDTISFNNNNKKSNYYKKVFGLFLISSGILEHSLSGGHQQGSWFNSSFMVYIKINPCWNPYYNMVECASSVRTPLLKCKANSRNLQLFCDFRWFFLDKTKEKCLKSFILDVVRELTLWGKFFCVLTQHKKNSSPFTGSGIIHMPYIATETCMELSGNVVSDERLTVDSLFWICGHIRQSTLIYLFSSFFRITLTYFIKIL